MFLVQLRNPSTDLTPVVSKPCMMKRFIKRDRETAYDHLYKDYFAEDLVNFVKDLECKGTYFSELWKHLVIIQSTFK